MALGTCVILSSYGMVKVGTFCRLSIAQAVGVAEADVLVEVLVEVRVDVLVVRLEDVVTLSQYPGLLEQVDPDGQPGIGG